MAQIMVDCADPNDIEQVQKAVEQAAGNCQIIYAKQHLKMVKAGTSKSQRQSAKKIAEETGENAGSVRSKIRRGMVKVGHVDPPKKKKKNMELSPQEIETMKLESKKTQWRRVQVRLETLRELIEEKIELPVVIENETKQKILRDIAVLKKYESYLIGD